VAADPQAGIVGSRRTRDAQPRAPDLRCPSHRSARPRDPSGQPPGQVVHVASAAHAGPTGGVGSRTVSSGRQRPRRPPTHGSPRGGVEPDLCLLGPRDAARWQRRGRARVGVSASSRLAVGSSNVMMRRPRGDLGRQSGEQRTQRAPDSAGPAGAASGALRSKAPLNDRARSLVLRAAGVVLIDPQGSRPGRNDIGDVHDGRDRGALVANHARVVARLDE
jgi:hypothetical protein